MILPDFVRCAEDSAHYRVPKTALLRAVRGTFQRLVSQFAGDDFL